MKHLSFSQLVSLSRFFWCSSTDGQAFVDETNIMPFVSSEMAAAAAHTIPHGGPRRQSMFPVKDVPSPPACPVPGDRGFGHTMTCTMCTACGRSVAPWRPMSRGSLQFSLGKYLELSFYNTELTARDTGCSHCPRDYHVRFFGRQSALVAFRFVSASLLIGVLSLLGDHHYHFCVGCGCLLDTCH